MEPRRRRGSGPLPRARGDFVHGAEEAPSQIRDAAVYRAEAEGPAWILLQFDTLCAGALDRSLDGVDRCVEVFLGYLKG